VRTKIICLGNELVCDDGVGIRVGRILAALPLPSHVTVELRAYLGLDLLDVICESKRIILVDAINSGGPPGTCVVMNGTQLADLSCKAALSHASSIAEAMAVAARLRSEEAIASIRFVGIEGRWFDRYGAELSPQVRAALPIAVDTVLRIIGADDALLAKAREESERALQSDPSISEILSRC
jgi:hydrogenase maturation protease